MFEALTFSHFFLGKLLYSKGMRGRGISSRCKIGVMTRIEEGYFGLCIYHYLNFISSLASLQPSIWVLHHELCLNLFLNTTNEKLFYKMNQSSPMSRL